MSILSPSLKEKLEAQLIEDEGYRNKAYLDTEGILSIGIGHNCINEPVPGVEKVGDRISDVMVMNIFILDLLRAIRDVKKYMPYTFEQDNEARQAVVINMMFNMGWPVLSDFKKFIRAFINEQYNVASAEMLDSKWARQTGRRAKRLAAQMYQGRYVELSEVSK